MTALTDLELRHNGPAAHQRAAAIRSDEDERRRVGDLSQADHLAELIATQTDTTARNRNIFTAALADLNRARTAYKAGTLSLDDLKMARGNADLHRRHWVGSLQVLRAFERELAEIITTAQTAEQEEPMDTTAIQSTLKSMEDAMKAKGLGRADASLVINGHGMPIWMISPMGILHAIHHFANYTEAMAFIAALPSPDAFAADFGGPLVLRSAA